MSVRTKVCCCHADTWTKSFAWFQMVTSFIAILLILPGTISVASQAEKSDKRVLIATGLGLIAFCAVAFTMGVILLLGSTKKRIPYLWSWIIFVGLLSIAVAASASVGIFIHGVQVIIPDLIQLAITCFQVWVVHAHILDIQAERQRNRC